MRSPEASPKPLLASVEAAWQHEGSGGLGESVIQREHQTIPRFAQYSQPLQTLSRRWRQGIRRLRRSALPRPTPGVLERLGLPAARGRILPIVMLALINISACTTSGFLQVSGTQPSAFRPAVAYNTKTKQFLVTYLREMPGVSGTPAEVRLRRFDVNGKGLGSELQPFGTGKHVALGRPAIAYNPKSGVYMLAAPAATTTGASHTVLVRFLNAQGGVVGKQLSLFGDQKWSYYDGDGVGALHVTYNSLSNEFLVTLQRTVQARYGKENGIWGQRVSQASGAIGTPVELLNTTVHGIHSHTVAYAPVQSPTGGRYLFAFSGFAGGAELLDKNAKSISGVSLDLGTPKGGSTHFDARFGKIAGKNSFLLVFSDDDNCRPGLTACTATKDQWSGVWGVYVDPMNPSAANTAFPISKIWNHLSAARVHKPRADYDPVRKSFFVVWREIPVLDPQNKESRSHIRANWINYYVKGGLAGTTQVPQPPVNTIVSTPTGNCVTAGASCLSAEDPDFPDAATTATGAVAVWHQKSPPNVKILGVVGQVLAAP